MAEMVNFVMCILPKLRNILKRPHSEAQTNLGFAIGRPTGPTSVTLLSQTCLDVLLM